MARRSALLPLVPLALLAAFVDAALYWSIRDHYARHGGLGLRLDLALMAVAITAVAVHAGIASWRQLLKKKKPNRPDAGAASPRKRQA
jgi:hypothetical protein